MLLTAETAADIFVLILDLDEAKGCRNTKWGLQYRVLVIMIVYIWYNVSTFCRLLEIIDSAAFKSIQSVLRQIIQIYLTLFCYL